MSSAGPQTVIGAPFVLRQSDLSMWAKCPLKYKYRYIDKLPEEQNGSAVFGSILHDVVMQMEIDHDPAAAQDRFLEYWINPALLDPTYRVDYYVKGTNWKRFLELGQKIIRDWWDVIKWDQDVNLGREHTFNVPIGDGHVLTGTVDKLALRYDPKHGRVVLISDYKTNSKVPTYEWLEDNLQFTAYAYASTQPEFWTGVPNGDALFRELANVPRRGEWVSLRGPKRLDAGERDQVQYNRLVMAANALAESVAMRIFVPNISGEACRYCEFRAQCGLRVILDDE